MEEYLNEFKPVYDLIDALEDPNAIDILQPQNWQWDKFLRLWPRDGQFINSKTLWFRNR